MDLAREAVYDSRGEIASPFPCTLKVFIRIQLSKSYIKKTERKSMEFPKTASQNTDYVSLSNPSFLICSFYLGPSLRLSFTNMAVQGPIVERLCSE